MRASRILAVILALLLLSGAAYAAVRVYDLMAGDSLDVTCHGDELTIIQNDKEAMLNCIEWTPTPTDTATPTFTPTLTPTPTSTPTATIGTPGVYGSIVVIVDTRDDGLTELEVLVPDGYAAVVDCNLPPNPEGPPRPPCLLAVVTETPTP